METLVLSRSAGSSCAPYQLVRPSKNPPVNKVEHTNYWLQTQSTEEENNRQMETTTGIKR